LSCLYTRLQRSAGEVQCVLRQLISLRTAILHPLYSTTGNVQCTHA
jgi:hypothetical protein